MDFENETYVEVEENTVENNTQTEERSAKELALASFDGDHVDMMDAMSILTYGLDILEEVATIRQALYSGDSNDKIGGSEELVERKLATIANFKTDLDKKEEIKQKVEERNETWWGRILNKISGDLRLLTSDTYAEALEANEQIIQELADISQAKAMEAHEAYEYNKDYLEQLNDILKRFKTLIDVGEIDLDEFKQKVELYKTNGPEVGEDDLIYNARIDAFEKHIFLFTDRLEKLKTARLSVAQLQTATSQKQTVNSQLMQQYMDNNTIALPILQSQANEIVDSRKQAENIKTAKAFADGIAEVIEQGADQIVKNVAEMQKIANEGAFKASTLLAVDKKLMESAKLVANGRKEYLKALEMRKKANAQVERNLETMNQIMRQAIDANTAETALLENAVLPELPASTEEKPKRKALGTNPFAGNIQ